MRFAIRIPLTVLAAFLLGAPAIVAGAPMGKTSGGRLEGTLVEARGGVLLLQTARVFELVAAQPGTTLLGIADVDRLLPGDVIRVAWTRSLAGVKLAEVLEADPAWTIPDLRLVVLPGPAAANIVPPDGSAPQWLALDARSAERFDAGHLPGARRLPAANEQLMKVAPDKQAQLLFYGEGPRDARPVAALRAAQAQGYANVRVLGGGVAAWQAAQLPMEIEPGGLAMAFAERRPFVIVDVRPAERAGQGTLPGAVSLPVATMSWRDFSGESWTPPFLLVAEDAKDPDLAQALQSLRSWRYQDQSAGYAPPWVLSGGFRAWAAAGNPVTRGAPLRTRMEPPVDVTKGEMARPEFLEIWTAQGNDGRLLLDVREASTESPPFARKVPLEELVHHVANLPRDREIVPFCDAGRRSRIATELLRRNGFKVRYFRGRLPN